MAFTLIHSEKFTNMNDFFVLKESSKKVDGIYEYFFQCIKCMPSMKIIKISSQCVTSNLKTHLKKIPPTLKNNFEEILKAIKYKRSISSDINKDTHDNHFEQQLILNCNKDLPKESISHLNAQMYLQGTEIYGFHIVVEK